MIAHDYLNGQTNANLRNNRHRTEINQQAGAGCLLSIEFLRLPRLLFTWEHTERLVGHSHQQHSSPEDYSHTVFSHQTTSRGYTNFMGE